MEKKELPRYPVIDIVATGRNIRRLRLEKGHSCLLYTSDAADEL